MTTLVMLSLLRLRILALIAFAATAGMSNLASGLNSAFGQIGAILGSYIT